MTDQEMTQLLGELAKGRTLSIIDRAAFAEALEGMSFMDAVQLLVELAGEHPMVTPAAVNAARGATARNAGELAWDNICRRVLGPEGAEHHAKGLPMPPELFTSEAERTAWRKTHQTIRTSNAETARRAFLAAYREASQAPARHLHSIEGGASHQLNAQEA